MGDARDTAKKKKADREEGPGQEARREGGGQGIGEVREEVTIPVPNSVFPGPGLATI